MSYTARPQNSPLATGHTAHFAFFASPHFQLSSSLLPARFAGQLNVRRHAPQSPPAHSAAHHRQALPSGIEEQPF